MTTSRFTEGQMVRIPRETSPFARSGGQRMALDKTVGAVAFRYPMASIRVA